MLDDNQDPTSSANDGQGGAGNPLGSERANRW